MDRVSVGVRVTVTVSVTDAGIVRVRVRVRVARPGYTWVYLGWRDPGGVRGWG